MSLVGGNNCCNFSGSMTSVGFRPFWKSVKLCAEAPADAGTDQPNPASCSSVNIDSVHWERVDFGTRARVQAFTTTLQNNSIDLTIAAVDPTRTIVFAGGQMAGGQSTGETAVDNNGDDSIGQAQARFDLTGPTSVKVTRGRSQSTGIVTFYVVELEP